MRVLDQPVFALEWFSGYHEASVGFGSPIVKRFRARSVGTRLAPRHEKRIRNDQDQRNDAFRRCVATRYRRCRFIGGLVVAKEVRGFTMARPAVRSECQRVSQSSASL
jgi:hypothetical protein